MAELARYHISNEDLMQVLNFKSKKTLNNKLSGRTEFTRKEMFLIKNKLFPDLDLDYLFSDSEIEN